MILIAGCLRFITQTDLLEIIRKRGVLRIGTPGDYHALSYFDGQKFVGYDIDMASYLAEQLGVDVDFVLTERPELVSGLYLGKFDIAMGGIPRTVSRQFEVEQTRGYMTFSHALLVTAENQERFHSFEKVNLPGVKVGVAIGEVYEKLAGQYFPEATIVPFENHLNIPLAVRSGQIDAMMTEMPLALFYQTTEKQLKVIREQTLTAQNQFSYLLPVGQQRLLNMVNLIMDEVKLKGVEQQLMAKHTLIESSGSTEAENNFEK
ncbi:transporter substrate-binding domain-containing protein [Vibrio mangrovi]|uniref:Cyclohexadienyl dehydratase n=1 Tax=Vibrio mangrovi TaxID=474394 RepID=A0A1Y6J043_9VIBR|nr:transporter substrate-binding domain-containing protein [Vibrio mangrovi]MDW6004891.1 transporter substrate-binding domain-containing protein [Vibrio mangrovi]SMS01653.1 Cyclohexadienyl dehydratase precursor [Vibrio mangrovi]